MKIEQCIRQKQLRLVELWRKLRKSVQAEKWLQDNVELEELMEWSHLRRQMPEPDPEAIPLYEHFPSQPAHQMWHPEVEALEHER